MNVEGQCLAEFKWVPQYLSPWVQLWGRAIPELSQAGGCPRRCSPLCIFTHFPALAAIYAPLELTVIDAGHQMGVAAEV